MTNDRLPDYIKPSNYTIRFEPNLKEFTFKGKETIKISASKPVKQIFLHSLDLKIKSLSVSQESSIPLKFSVKSDQLAINLTRPLNQGEAEIKIEFEGKINDNLNGFYRSKYKDLKGKEKYLATTQFEAPYARKAFPCFDEPNKKATFDITLEIKKNLKAVSNMPILSETKKENKKILVFQKTPIMSTYLLYMLVGELEFLEGKYKDKEIRIVTTPGKSKEGEFALDLTKKFLKYFEDYSEIPYPLPKLDMIAIPDFSAGAMENWGAITFREIILLYNEKKTSVLVKKRIAEVIAHELWHQWSGNLVTMDWWEDLWLNESFATYMAYKAMDFYFPEWKIMEDFISEQTLGALNDDALLSTHPIKVKVNTPNEIEEIFDAISYGKGGNILRMIESYIGKENFRKGVSSYLKKFKYINAQASDLWESLAQTSTPKIRGIIENWIDVPGYPIVKSKLSNTSLHLTQERFSYKKTKDSIWKIPLIIQTSNGAVKEIFEEKSTKIQLKNPKWFKLNPYQEGFYRVKYEEKELEVLGHLVLNKKIPAIDRWILQNDIFNLSLSNEITLDCWLDFLKYYKNEDNFLVLGDIYSNIKRIYNSFYDQADIEKIREIIEEPFEKLFEKLSWKQKKGENEKSSLLRALAVSYLGFAKKPEIIKESLKLFKKPKEIAPDLKAPIFTIIAENFPKEYNKMLSLYENSNDLEEKLRLLTALYRFKDQGKLKRSLNFALSKKVRFQNLRNIFGSISANPELKSIFFQWVKSNWNEIKKWQKTTYVFMDFLEAFITLYSIKEKKAISSFLKSKKVKYEKTKANSFEIMEIQSSWVENNKEILRNYFS